MNRKFYVTLLGAALAVGAVSCSDDDDSELINGGQNEMAGKIELTSSQLATVSKCNNFGFKLLDAISSSEEFRNKNIILSPISANYAFSMLANAADSETREEIITGLGYENMSVDELNALNKKLTGELGGLDGKVSLNFANSVWALPSIEVKDGFKSDLSTYYNADVKMINQATVVADINNWCSKNTNGKIPEFISDNLPNIDAALLNAVYFKGLWSTGYKFDAKNTTTDYFNDVNGTRSQASFMKQKNAFIYNKTSTMQKCELSFGNRSFGIAFILPNEGVTLNQAITNLANGDWEALSGTALPESPYNCFGVDLSLPKFKIETDVVFEQYMAALGMGNVLSPTADYSNMADGIQFNYMEQKSIFEIDENGAEAASVTGGFDLSANEHHPQMVTMTFDRPFLYVLFERSTGTILFAGCVNSFAN